MSTPAATSPTPPNLDGGTPETGNELFLDRYQVTKILGEGSYGRVKLAVALKIINKTSIKKPEHVTRIKREVRILRLLNHPNIVKLYDVAETDKEIILSMEYIEGGELFDFIVANPRLNEKIARRIFRQIISAVDYCHQSSVIHRDLKPENLLLDNNKNIKIIDFGFVNLYDPENVLKTFCGSPFYASPEMILGKKYVGPEVDIWSMGVILFALLAGKLPFRDSNVKDLYKKITSSAFDLPPCIGKESGDLIKIMLKADPTERASLEQIRNHEWVTAGYEGPPDSFVPPRPPAAEPISKTTLSTMRLYGFDEDVAKKAVLTSTSHPAFLLYSLIREHDAAEASMQAMKSSKSSESQELRLNANGSALEIPSSHHSVRRRKSMAAIGSVSNQTTFSSYDALKGDTQGRQIPPLRKPDGSSDAVYSQPKISVRARKSISGIPGAAPPSVSMLRNEIPATPALPLRFTPTTAIVTSPDSPPTDSGNQLSIPGISGIRPKERGRSLSFRISRTDTGTALGQRKGSLVPPENASQQGSSNTLDPSSPNGTLKPGAAPQRRLSISKQIGNALSKIIQLPRSRRNSADILNTTPRVTKSIYGVDTTSGKQPNEIVAELNRVFELNSITPTWSGYKVSCVAPGLVFEIEICSIKKTQMHGLELRRKKGTVWTYQSVCSSVISQLKL
ncbi:Map microtubule affinity-regulating kinase [Podochytrium sp. JEL0797]|nr:Map microtubule affinity-regulating kinase [Podochytrium sp. JEL0797]